MTKEQELMWAMLSHNYPTKRRCKNCIHWFTTNDYGCELVAGRICDIYYKPENFHDETDPGPKNIWRWDMKND